ncbi:hypothetical protein [Planctomicrobium piriforme]|uniref:Uncharacterized protein n=1 Tax=Planctomicrobium piriforme TaxID=1576369 RepID=A0A1I3QE17_9PLAN|nr:hypothetical protein [Planctomicrobium piriforme]SFJ32504.1 hypothetical protein SAMN05421753_11867 [Planctomicrobium piriforme]
MPVISGYAPAFPRPLVAGERLRAPTQNADIFSRPDMSRGRGLAEQNAQSLNRAEITIGGRSLQALRTWTRQVCVQSAQDWMQQALGIAPAVDSTAPHPQPLSPEYRGEGGVHPAVQSGLLFVTGHQPSLNHPGVWVKNVAVAHLARCSGGQGLNLIVDNDLAGPPAIRVPAGTRAEPHFSQVPFDTDVPTEPWEERELQNPALFHSFPQRVNAEVASWGFAPTLAESWPAAVSALDRTKNVATLLTACRVADERSWDVANLELPVSVLCQTEPFLVFALDLIQSFERFFEAYNGAVHRYRAAYGVRNHRHPVPDLERQQDRFELPFWYWEAGARDRQRLFASRQPDRIDLFAGDRCVGSVPVSGHDVSSLQQLQSRCRLRTRALTTTLFTRLCLSDLFLHGIGGARYDEITDLLFGSFYGIDAPGFLTLTATVRLPLEPFPVTQKQISALKQRLRRLQFHGPDATDSSRVAELKQEQTALIAAARSQKEQGLSRSERRARRAENRRRHLQLKQCQVELASLATAAIEQTRQELETAIEQLRANRVLASREFPACLFPRELLQPAVDRLRRQTCGQRAADRR